RLFAWLDGDPQRRKVFTRTAFSEQLRTILKLHGISQGKLMQDLNISASALYKWLTGAGPRTDTLKKLADYFGCSVDFLIGRVR
ncbi:MAG: helix-turn-helix transcriptional regulator, partial [Clostridia bacterium]|nr:helix-turn-helix transcriptional regulator [Clostridia bacterium]